MCGAISIECETESCRNFVRYDLICYKCKIVEGMKENYKEGDK